MYLLPLVMRGCICPNVSGIPEEMTLPDTQTKTTPNDLTPFNSHVKEASLFPSYREGSGGFTKSIVTLLVNKR